MKLQSKYADLVLNLMVAVAISLVVNFSYVLLMLVDLNTDTQSRPAGERSVERSDEGILSVHPEDLVPHSQYSESFDSDPYE